MPGPDFWNKRYGGEEWAYGEAPNDFLAQACPIHIPSGSSVVELGAGEGRNAVHLAELGHRVTAVDQSSAGLAKVAALAERRGVAVQTVLADATRWHPDELVDAVVISFLHLHKDRRGALYANVRAMLRPGGVLVAEWFAPDQVRMRLRSGGPGSLEMLADGDELQGSIEGGSVILLEEVRGELEEGPFHRGPARLLRFVWEKSPGPS